MARLTAILISLAALTTAASAGDLYPFEMKAREPAMHAALKRVLPAVKGTQSWLPGLDGTSGPMTPVEIGGKSYMTGYVCRPGDCRENRLVFLVVPDGSAAVAVVRVTDRAGERVIVRGGGPAETAYLEGRLND